MNLDADNLKSVLSLPGMSNTSDVLARIAAPQLSEAPRCCHHHKEMHIQPKQILSDSCCMYSCSTCRTYLNPVPSHIIPRIISKSCQLQCDLAI